MRCGKSHDLDLILDAEEKERDSKKRRKQPSTVEAQTILKPETAVAPGTTVNPSDGAGPSLADIAVVVADSGSHNGSSSISAATLTPAAADTNSPTVLQSEMPSQSVAASQQPTTGPSHPALNAVGTKETENVVLPGEKFHSAYYDAFMTGTIFLHQLHHHGIETIESQAKNKIYLIGKSFPLTVEKSSFTKYSPSHERQRAL
jgi:target of EGR1 protein 1